MKIASYFTTMWQLAVILIAPQIICALNKNLNEGFENNHLNFEESNDAYDVTPSSKTLWVLSLDDDQLAVRLKAGDLEDIEDFDDATGPMIASTNRQRIIQRAKAAEKLRASSLNMQTNKTEATTKKEDTIKKKQLLKIINKFTMSMSQEPDTYMPINSEKDGTSLKLYFEGPYTLMIVKLGHKQWHYFLTPSPLPAWFNEPHTDIKHEGNDAYVDIPNDVKDELFKTLLRLMEKIVGFPI